MDIDHLYLWCTGWLRAGLNARRSDERGIGTLETVLLVGGLAVMALAAIAAIGVKVRTATDNIPTGP